MRIAIVNDLPMAVEGLKRAIAKNPDYKVCWIAGNGREALDLCQKDRPDLILMDLIMPEVDGVEATRLIMASCPCPILVVTQSIDSNISRVFNAMGHGALDAVCTPAMGAGGGGADILLKKIRSISKVIGHKSTSSVVPLKAVVPQQPSFEKSLLVAIGSSSGGPNALRTVIRQLPVDLSIIVVIVQHIDIDFSAELANWLNVDAPMKVELATDFKRIQEGHIYVAKGADHLIINKDGILSYTQEPKDLAYRPSVDVFFNSLADNWSGRMIGIILTGMGRDGTQGLLRMRKAGALTVAQDKETSTVYGMPKAAKEANAAMTVVPLDKIARLIKSEAACFERISGVSK